MHFVGSKGLCSVCFFFLFLFFLTLGEGGRQEGRLAYLVFAEWFSVGESFTM